MTTRSPAYYRDLMVSIAEQQEYNQLPKWFLTAWQYEDVKITGDQEMVQFECEFPVKHYVCTGVVVQFLIDKTGDVFCQNWTDHRTWSGIYFTFVGITNNIVDVDFRDPVYDFLEDSQDAKSELAALATAKLQIPIKKIIYSINDNLYEGTSSCNLVTKVDWSACDTIKMQLRPVGLMLYKLGLQELDK